ncbi:aminotransferase class I/II-fold pyridoxal phosphate-dependent enzyme [Streptomyces sp. NPDC088350]|uniref:aminotransferase class I/II-fold pyridoxal phosphate-dependent enzyme n=1 Tax=Streptomyces sp. NPDC088350 TaxID=3365854 RepID=UPI00380A5FD7
MRDQIAADERSLLSLDDYARAARERLDPDLWDHIESGAGEERTLADNRACFDRVRLRPSVLTDVVEAELRTKVLGRSWGAPIVIAPAGCQTMLHPDGELATVRAAARFQVPTVVSTSTGRGFTELAEATAAPLWLRLDLFRDRQASRRLVADAEDAGFEALVLAVDSPRFGRRPRDLRDGVRLPPGDRARDSIDPGLGWKVVEELRGISRLPILLKGILCDEDAARATGEGVDGIIVSSYGDRRFDGAPAPLDVLPEVVAAVGDRCPVLLDGGVRRGRDVLAALALGADAVLLGRPVLHGLAVAGGEGVADVLDLLTGELADVLAFTGTASVTDAHPALVRFVPGAERSEPVARPATLRPGPAADLHAADLFPGVDDPVMDTMNFLNEITLRYPDAISFAPGRPQDRFLDTEQIFDYLRRYLEHLAGQGRTPEQIRDAVFQYGPTAGQIRPLIADALAKDEGILVAPESIVVTVGAQEAMFLVLRGLFSRPEDVLLVSSPCYVGIIGAARLLDVEVRAVEERETGLSPRDVEAAVLAELRRGRRPRAIYVIPDHSNPSGVTMSEQARTELLDVATRHDLLILEDSPYRLVSPGRQLPTLKSLDRRRRVVELGSFSKTIFPGARVGYVVADQVVAGADGGTELLADRLCKIKSMITVNTSALGQAAVAGALLTADGRLADLNARTSDYYGHTMRTTLDRLGRSFGPELRDRLGVRWNTPSGGFFLRLEVPFRADNAALVRSAEEFGVIWTPMSYFYPTGGGERAIRLSVSCLTDHEIEEGTARLARFVASTAAR